MKHFGNISNLADVVTKQYVDDLMGGSHTPSATDTYSLGTQSLRYLAAHIKTLTVATLSSVNNNQILLSDAAPYNYYLGVNGAATKLASLTVTSLTANGQSAIADATDYSVSQGIASAALTVNGGVHVAMKLHVGSDTYLDSTLSVVGAAELGSSLTVTGNTGLGTAADSSNKLSVSGNTQLSGVLNITGVTGYAQGIRIHPSSGTSSIWFGAVNNTGFDAGMWGITVDTVTGDTPSTKIRIRGTATADSTTPVDYLTIINGGYVGINVTPSTSYRLYVSGASRFNGTVNLGGTIYYLGNGAAASNLYSLTVGSATALSVSSAGVVSVANTTPFSGTASTGALKVSGGAYIAGNLGVYGKKIYFDSTHYLEYDSTNNALHAYNMGFYADSFVNSGGLGVNGEGSGGSAITMLGSSSLGGSFGDSDLTQAFNAYTVNYINNRVTATNSTLSSLRAGNIEFTSLLLQNTNNSPTLNFKGEYNNSQGANITLGSLSGYKETISSVAYTGLKVSSDLFIPNGKHLYTYDYNGNPRSAVFYPSANYDYLQLGDSGCATNIKGSTVEIGAALSVTGNIVPTSNATYNLGSSSKRFERAYIRYIDTPSGVLLRFCTAGTEAMNISTGGNVNIGSTSSASYKLQVNGTFYASGAATLGSSLSTSGDISTSGDVVITKTANNPAVTFKGEYDNNLGANITLGSITGNKETISSVTYTGVKVSSDFFIPNGKHLYTYNYSGAPRSIAYYATSNYNYLQLGDASGVTNIKGSTVQINDNAIGTAAYKGTATSISSSSTDSNLATAKAVYTYVNANCVTSSVLEDYVLSSSLGTAAYKGVATSISSSSTDDNLATAKAVYDGCLPKYSTSYSSSKITKSTTDKWWRIGSISTCYSSIELAFGNSYSNNEPAYAYFNISQGYTNDGVKIGQPCYIITQTGGYSKFVKAIRLVYFKTSRGTGYTTAYIEVLIAANCTNTLYCQATSSRAAITWLTTPTAGVIGASSASTDYAAVTLYTSRGPSTSGGYNCTWLFDLAANASIVQTETTKANFIMEDFLNALATGTPLMWVTESVTMNGVTYTMRYDVHVGKRGTAGLMLYYYNSPNSGTVEMTCIEIGYSSGWKVTAKYTKTL